MINLKTATFGAEYEFGDIRRDAELPEGLSWNTKDYSIVSSTGIANDPKGELYALGGEINTQPTVGWRGQMELFERLLEARPEAALNHRTNLHIHIGIPGLMGDLLILKQILWYIDQNQKAVYDRIEPIPEPKQKEYPDPAAYKGARKRYNRRKISHQKCLPPARVEEALAAETVDDFIAGLATPKKDGGRAWAISTRAGMNMMQLRETETIEFRHFTNTLDPNKLRACFEWVEAFMYCAKNGEEIEGLFLNFKAADFPRFLAYSHPMEIGYQWTNFDHNSRRKVGQRIAALKEYGLDLERCDARDTAQAIQKIDPEFYAKFA